MALQSKKCEPRRVNHGDVAKMSQLSLRVIVRWLPICKYDTEQCLIYQGGPQNYRNIFEPQILQLKNSVEKREGEGRYFVFLANINKRACLLCWHNMKDYFYSPLPYAIPKKGNNPSIQSSQLPTYISICELTESFLLLTIFFFFFTLENTSCQGCQYVWNPQPTPMALASMIIISSSSRFSTFTRGGRQHIGWRKSIFCNFSLKASFGEKNKQSFHMAALINHVIYIMNQSLTRKLWFLIFKLSNF